LAGPSWRRAYRAPLELLAGLQGAISKGRKGTKKESGTVKREREGKGRGGTNSRNTPVHQFLRTPLTVLECF